MRNIKYILVAATILLLFCSCSAERKLAYLLQHHPELRTGTDTVMVLAHIPLPYDADSIDIPTPVLLGVESQPAEDSTAETLALPICITAGHAKATLTKTDNGFRLTAEQIEDTIEVEIPVETPSVNIHTLPVEEKPINTFFRQFGYISMGVMGIGVLLCFGIIIKKFLL